MYFTDFPDPRNKRNRVNLLYFVYFLAGVKSSGTLNTLSSSSGSMMIRDNITSPTNFILLNFTLLIFLTTKTKLNQAVGLIESPIFYTLNDWHAFITEQYDNSANPTNFIFQGNDLLQNNGSYLKTICIVPVN